MQRFLDNNGGLCHRQIRFFGYNFVILVSRVNYLLVLVSQALSFYSVGIQINALTNHIQPKRVISIECHGQF